MGTAVVSSLQLYISFVRFQVKSHPSISTRIVLNHSQNGQHPRKAQAQTSHKDQAANFDEHDSADEETMDYVTKEADDAEREGHDTGKPGSFLNRLIMHGNKKTEEQLAREAAARNAEAGSADRVVTQR